MQHQDNEQEETDSQEKVILVVEDDKRIGYLLIETIEEETPYRVMLAPDGFQALKVIRIIKPHLLLIDYMLPSMDGLELYDQLHATEEFKHIPVLFMSATPPTKALQERGGISCVKKPFNLEDLLHAIEDSFEDDEAT
ncbi:response regulator [Dictyobacter formicarum]|uniref:Response regulatory domain-containing protein n=1 Tax=Dictyobacter formicarum TaxID=2778368 RepID=A0ABQ3VF69_9CHLR|nr:response regulator [Dictyobacter formicarum]GHO84033.1 hypothetical protein KSZ_20390 [Dictyobacter formicarum]